MHKCTVPLQHKVLYLYLQSTTVYVPSSEIRTPPTSLPSECALPPDQRVGEAHSPGAKGVGTDVPIPTTGEKAEHSAYSLLYSMYRHTGVFFIEIFYVPTLTCLKSECKCEVLDLSEVFKT